LGGRPFLLVVIGGGWCLDIIGLRYEERRLFSLRY
jgi:hypothetical protein